MTVSIDLRDKRALVLRLIVAEALSRRGDGPLARKYGLPKLPKLKVTHDANPQVEPKDPVPR